MTQSRGKQLWEEAWLQAGGDSHPPASLFPKAQEDPGAQACPLVAMLALSVRAAGCLCCGTPMGVRARQGPVPRRPIKPLLAEAAWRGPVLLTLQGHRWLAGLAGHRGPPSGPMRFHTARLPGRQGHPGWLAPLSWCPRPGLNISGRLSAGFGRAGEGSYTFTASSLREPPVPTGPDDACGGVCGRLDLW